MIPLQVAAGANTDENTKLQTHFDFHTTTLSKIKIQKTETILKDFNDNVHIKCQKSYLFEKTRTHETVPMCMTKTHTWTTIQRACPWDNTCERRT